MHSLNQVQKFVYAKILEMKMSEANALSKKYSKAKRKMLEFSENKKLFETLSKSSSGLGEIKIKPCVSLSSKL